MSFYKKMISSLCFGLVLLSHSAFANNKHLNNQKIDIPPIAKKISYNNSRAVIASNFKRKIIGFSGRRT